MTAQIKGFFKGANFRMGPVFGGFSLQQFCLMERNFKCFEGDTRGWNLILSL
jgi:hypothetical protein